LRLCQLFDHRIEPREFGLPLRMACSGGNEAGHDSLPGAELGQGFRGFPEPFVKGREAAVADRETVLPIERYCDR
jgi:hypothetical protein